MEEVKVQKKRSKKLGILVVVLIIALLAVGVYYYLTHESMKTKGLTDQEIYDRLLIQFNVDDDEDIYVNQKMDSSYSCWKLVKGYNGTVSISPDNLDISKVADHEVVFTVTLKNDKGEDISKQYKKIIKVAQSRPSITLKEKEITLDLNEEFDKEKWYSVTDLDKWILNVDCDVNTQKMGKYYLTVSATNPDTKEVIKKEMVINVVDKTMNNDDGCTYVWVVDKEATKEIGHYETINVAEQGHWGRFLVSAEEGHWETIHHEEKSHIEWDSEIYYIFTFVLRSEGGLPPEQRTGDVVKTSYELAEMGMTAGEYFAFVLGSDYGNYYSTTTSRAVNPHKVIDKEAWDEEVWVVDKEAVYEDRWVVDCEAYSYKVWIVDVPAQKEVGHWEKKCD